MTFLPQVKLKAIVSFPAKILDGVGVDVIQQDGTYQFDLAFNDFAPPVAGIPDPTNQTVLLWNVVTQQYALTPIALFGGGGGVPEAPIDGILYGRKDASWQAVPAGGGGTPSNTNPLMDGVAAPGIATAYSRGDHVHPSDTSRQASDADLTAVAALSGIGIARRTSAVPAWSVGDLVSNLELALMPAFTFKGNNTGGAASPTDVDIAALTTKASPAGGDYVLLSDQSASGAWKKLPVSSFPGASGGITEAPNDGLQYGRQSLGWTVISGGGVSPSNALPAMNGAANAGVSALYSRGDHVHPVDTSRQPADAELTALAGLVSAVDTLPYFTGSGTAALAAFSAFARTLIDDADAAAMRTTLGLTGAATATPAALSRTNDTNVTLTLGGSPNTALLQATSITVGWSGTLSAARGGFGMDISGSSGVPLFAAGVPTFTATTGTGNIARDSSIPVAATAAEYLANSTATKYLAPGAVWTAAAPLASGPNASLTPNFGAAIDFDWTINSASSALNNGTNLKVGQKGIIYVRQGAANSLITTWGSDFKFPGGVKPTLSTAINSVDAISYAVLTASFVACTFQADFK